MNDSTLNQIEVKINLTTKPGDNNDKLLFDKEDRQNIFIYCAILCKIMNLLNYE